jgi:hypothetical protein
MPVPVELLRFFEKMTPAERENVGPSLADTGDAEVAEAERVISGIEPTPEIAPPPDPEIPPPPVEELADPEIPPLPEGDRPGELPPSVPPSGTNEAA